MVWRPTSCQAPAGGFLSAVCRSSSTSTRAACDIWRRLHFGEQEDAKLIALYDSLANTNRSHHVRATLPPLPLPPPVQTALHCPCQRPQCCVCDVASCVSDEARRATRRRRVVTVLQRDVCYEICVAGWLGQHERRGTAQECSSCRTRCTGKEWYVS